MALSLPKNSCTHVYTNYFLYFWPQNSSCYYLFWHCTFNLHPILCRLTGGAFWIASEGTCCLHLQGWSECGWVKVSKIPILMFIQTNFSIFGNHIDHAIIYSDTATSTFTPSFVDLQEVPSELLLKEHVASIFRVEVSGVGLKCQALSSAHEYPLCGQFHFCCSVASSLRTGQICPM
jgi:hypothetical protein